MSEGSETKLEKTPSLFDRIFPEAAPAVLGDFTTTRRVVPIALLAVCIGVLSGFVALALLELIGLFTSLFFFQRFSTEPGSLGDGRERKRAKPSQSVAFRA